MQFTFSRRYLVLLTVAVLLTACANSGVREVVATPNAPAAIGPYSQAIRIGNTLYLSGQIAIDPKTNQVNNGTIEEQTRQVLENLKAVLAANQMEMRNIVSTTVYLRDLNDFSKMNAVYGTYFSEKAPARATIQAARLPRDVAIEISAIAVK